MSRLINIPVASVVALLLGSGCLLSPQPEPPDIREIDDDYPGYYDDYANGEAPPDSGAWDCEDPDFAGDCDGAGGDEPSGCGCRSDDADPGDCGEDTVGPSDIERGRMQVFPGSWVGAAANDDGDDNLEPTAEY